MRYSFPLDRGADRGDITFIVTDEVTTATKISGDNNGLLGFKCLRRRKYSIDYHAAVGRHRPQQPVPPRNDGHAQPGTETMTDEKILLRYIARDTAFHTMSGYCNESWQYRIEPNAESGRRARQ